MRGKLKGGDDLPGFKSLAEFCKDERWADKTGRLHWVDGEGCSLCKKAGTTLKVLAKTDRGFLDWICKNDFPQDVKEIVSDALVGRFKTKLSKSNTTMLLAERLKRSIRMVSPVNRLTISSIVLLLLTMLKPVVT